MMTNDVQKMQVIFLSKDGDALLGLIDDPNACQMLAPIVAQYAKIAKIKPGLLQSMDSKDIIETSKE